jgi:protein gp37
MAATTGISWTDATANFWIGCTHVGPGCGEIINGKQIGCYAEVFADQKFNIKFGPGERRHRTQAGYQNPPRWQRAHEKAAFAGVEATMQSNHATVPVPVWVFCNSLSDFFDNEIDPQWRTDAWAVIRACPSLRWQIVTKRVGNVAKMLPGDWNEGRNYRNVGIIGTMVNQDEYDRDAPKLQALYNLGVHWTGISIEPQLGPVRVSLATDWIITGGESNQGEHHARPYDPMWAHDLIAQGALAGVPVFVKQMGDNPVMDGKRILRLKAGGTDMSLWPPQLRVQRMPRVYNDVPAGPVKQSLQPSLFQP